MENFFKCLIAASVLLSASVQASFVPVSEWHNTNDQFGGLKQSRYSENVFFAVAKSNVFQKNATYEMLSGYRLASSQEYADIIQSYIDRHGSLAFSYNYYNSGGWNGYRFEDLARHYLTYADTADTGWVTHTGTNDNIAQWSKIIDFESSHAASTVGLWAGFVLVKEVTPVMAPPSFAVFGLATLLVGFRRKWLSRDNRALQQKNM